MISVLSASGLFMEGFELIREMMECEVVDSSDNDDSVSALVSSRKGAVEHGFKGGGKEAEKKDQTTSSSVRCIFVRMDSKTAIDANQDYRLARKTIQEARSQSMHVRVEVMDDICCRDGNGNVDVSWLAIEEGNFEVEATAGDFSSDEAEQIAKDPLFNQMMK